ncbi:hydroxymethylbilane synthase [Cellulomonas sp. PhB150]|uniref:hydroxymethylbilane synthase n=1 Tax=Cellulomonas sp. PhB150 TaxID=2485188 RepID=UPI000F4865C9|nr:hydroxymethylbilane synthase [Cellulomonas sp. PhB150]ROS23883.1 hydroxymethylbilane synthase [Cellulomonas sp. PhB150]
MPQHVRIGTRASALALTQTGHVADALAALADLEVETVRVRTDGDRLTGSLQTLGGTGVFVTALRDALLDGRCDVAVHSLKDLPTGDAAGLALGAVPLREDPRDALCARDGLTLETLPTGAVVGTGSPRRAAQLLAARPDVVVVDIRGNVDTRLGRVAGSGTGPGDLDAVVLARAGLARLGRLDAVTELFDPAVMAPAPGQGALAIEVRATEPDDAPLAAALRALDHAPTRLAVVAERALLARLEAGCAAPIGALATVTDDAIRMDAVVARPDGTATLRRSASTPGPTEDAARALGTRLAEDLLAAGAADLAELGATR